MRIEHLSAGLERLRRGGAVCLVAALSGCAAVANARQAQDAKLAVPGERTPTAESLGLPVTGRIALEDVLRIGLTVHPTIVQARRDTEAAAARTGQAEGAFLPTLALNANVQYRNQKPGVLPSGLEEHTFQSYGFQVSWLLFDFGRTSAFARQAASQWLAAQADERSAHVDVAFRVKSAYFTLEKQFRLREVARETVAQFEEHLDQVREFVDAGTRIPYDATKAEVDLGNSRLLLVRAEDALLLAEADLANAMGLAEIVDWETDFPDSDTEVPAPFDVCWEEARRSRPTIAAAAAREEAASALVDASIAALYPEVSLGFGGSASGSSTPFGWGWQVGPSVSWVPFDGFTNLYSIDEAAANLRAERTARARAEQDAWLDVRTAWLAIVDAHRRLELTSLLVRSADENMQLAQGRFDVGRGTAVEITDARQALAQARADDVQARADFDIATAGLARAVGSTEDPPRAANGVK